MNSKNTSKNLNMFKSFLKEKEKEEIVEENINDYDKTTRF